MAIIFPIAYKVDTSQLTGAQTAVAGFASKLKGLVSPLALVAAGAAAAFGIGKLVDDSVKSFETLASSTLSLQRVIGGTTEQVSGLKGAFQLAGIQSDQVTTSLTRFSKNLVSAGSSSKKAADFQKEFGTSVLDSNGHVKNLAEILPDIANKFASMQNGSEKTALAVTLFGRSGAQLLPILNKGADGIAELTSKAQAMGLVIDDAAAAKFRESKKAQREWQATMEGLSVTIGSAMLPVVNGLKEAIQAYLIPAIENATAWVKKNHEVFDNLANTIKATLYPVFLALVAIITDQIVPAFVNLGNFIQQNIGWLSALAIGVAAGIAVWEGYKAVQFILGAVTVFQQALTAAVFGGTLATEEHMVAQKLAAVWYAITNSTLVTSTIAWISNTAAIVANTEGGLLAKAAVIAQSVATGLATAAQWAWNAALDANPIALVVIAIAGLVAALVWFFTQTKLGQQIWSGFVGFLQDSMKNLGSFFATVWNGIATAFGAVFKGIGDAFKGYVNIWIGLINAIIGALDSIKIDIPKWVPIVGGQTFGVNIPKIPQLAEGGIVPATPGGRLVNVAEGGQAEAIIPLSKMGKTGGGSTVINLTVHAGMGSNGTSVGREIVNVLKQYERANGAVWKSA